MRKEEFILLSGFGAVMGLVICSLKACSNRAFTTIESMADEWGMTETTSICNTVKTVCVAAISGCTACFLGFLAYLNRR